MLVSVGLELFEEGPLCGGRNNFSVGPGPKEAPGARCCSSEEDRIIHCLCSALKVEVHTGKGVLCIPALVAPRFELLVLGMVGLEE